ASTARTWSQTAHRLPAEVLRACHTLHGSLTMAGVGPAVALAGPLNDLVGMLFESHLEVTTPVLEVCRETSAVVAGIVRDLREATPSTPDTSALTARIEALAEEVARLAAESSPADTGTQSIEVSALEDEDPETGTGAEEIPAAGSFARDELSPSPELPVAGMTFFDVEVAEIFAEEATELLESCEHALAQLSLAPADEPAMAELQRGLHTLKGGARMAGLPAMGDLSHELE